MKNNLICKYILFTIIIFGILKFIPNTNLNNKDISVLTCLIMLIIIFFDVNYNNKCKIIKEGMTETTNNDILNTTPDNQKNIIMTYNKEQKNNLINDTNNDKLNEIFNNLDIESLNFIVVDLELNNMQNLITKLNNDNLFKLLSQLNNDNINNLIKNIDRNTKKKFLNLLDNKPDDLYKFLNNLNVININDLIIDVYDDYLNKFVLDKNNINKIISLTKIDTNIFIINNLSNENTNILIDNLDANNLNLLLNNLNDEYIEILLKKLNDNTLNNLFNNLNDDNSVRLKNNQNLKNIISKLTRENIDKLNRKLIEKQNNNLNEVLTYLHGNINYDNINKYIDLVNIASYNPIYSKAIINRTKIDNEFKILIKLIEVDKDRVLELSKSNKLKNIINEIVDEKKDDNNNNQNNNSFNDEEIKTKKYLDTLIGKNKYFDNNGIVKNVVDTDLKYSNLTLEQMEKLGEYDNTFSNNWQNDYILLNTDKWRPPVGNQYKCKAEKECPVCPSLTYGYPVNVREFNNVRKILPPDNISIDYIKDKLNK